MKSRRPTELDQAQVNQLGSSHEMADKHDFTVGIEGNVRAFDASREGLQILDQQPGFIFFQSKTGYILSSMFNS